MRSLRARCGAASSAYDYVFAENGLVAFKAGEKLAEAVRVCAVLASFSACVLASALRSD